MKTNLIKIFMVLFFCLLTYLYIFSPVHAQSTVEIKEGTKLRTDTTTFIMGANFSFSRIEIKGAEIVLGDYNLSVYSSGANPNVTITKFFTDYQTVFNIEGEAGSYAIINLYTGSYGEPSSIKVNETPLVKNEDWWWYSSNATVKVNITFESVRKLELNWPVPETTISPTTIPSGDGGGPGGPSPGTTAFPVEEPKLTYSMPTSLKIYQNETKEFMIKLNNPGTVTLHNITIDILGIPKPSYTLSPYRVNSLEANKSTYFTVSIDTRDIGIGSYTLRINITSEETFEETTMTLKVEEMIPGVTTTTVTTISPEEEGEIEARVDTVKILLIVAVIVFIAIAIVNYYIRKKKTVKVISETNLNVEGVSE